MGLALVVYTNVKKADAYYCNEDEEVKSSATGQYMKENHFYARDVPAQWPGRSGIIEQGLVYTFDEKITILQETYSNYTQWRHFVRSAVIVCAEDKNAFSELINFSDCEGVLGTEVCTKLATDFKRHERLMMTQLKHDIWFTEIYNRLNEGFAKVGNNGIIAFH
jgi:hypothetical protein